MNRLYTALAKYFERRAGIHAHGSRTCSACHLRIRKNDKFRHLDVRHWDCAKPTEMPLPEPLMKYMGDGE